MYTRSVIADTTFYKICKGPIFVSLSHGKRRPAHIQVIIGQRSQVHLSACFYPRYPDQGLKAQVTWFCRIGSHILDLKIT